MYDSSNIGASLQQNIGGSSSLPPPISPIHPDNDDDLPMYEPSTDKAKIPRKRLKPGKLEHGNGRAREKPGESYQNGSDEALARLLVTEYASQTESFIIMKKQDRISFLEIK
ncbi:hypothetical protein Tco_0534474 [Tanacetum coccineum]